VPYPDVNAKLPAVELESEQAEFGVLTDNPEPDFHDVATVALEYTYQPQRQILIGKGSGCQCQCSK
jgi:hypothetical protein